MSIHFSGTLTRSKGIVSAIGKQLKSINLKGVKRITVTFDPFAENVKHTRDFLFLLSSPKVTKTNPNCLVKADVVCNRAPAEVKISLIEAAQQQAKVKEIRFLSNNLSTLELLQLYNKHITPLAPPEDTSANLATKSTKQKAAGGASAAKKRK